MRGEVEVEKKFCPSDFFAEDHERRSLAQWRRLSGMSCIGHVRGELDGGDHAARIGNPWPAMSKPVP